MPRERVWNRETAQKCERCGSRNLPCGPNLTREDDPEAFIRPAVTERPYDSFTTVDGYQGLLGSTDTLDGDNTGTMSVMFGEDKEGEGDSEACFGEKLKNKASAKYTLPLHIVWP